MSSAPATVAHPWRSHWSKPTLAGMKLFLAGRMPKWEKEGIVELIAQEHGTIVEEVTADVNVVVLLVDSVNPPPAQKKAEQLNKKSGAQIEVLTLDEFRTRMRWSGEEILDMLRTGAPAINRWRTLYSAVQAHGLAPTSVPTTSLSGLDLSGFPLETLDFAGVDFSNAVLIKTSFGAVVGAKFDGARLNDARFASAARCSFVGAQADRVTIGGASPVTKDVACDFSQASLVGATFHSFRADASRFVEADLTGAHFVQMFLTGADFSRAKLAGALIQQSDATQACFAGADLTRADISETRFQSADFRQAKLIGSKLYKADFTDAQLAGADLTDAKVATAVLTPEQLQSTVGRPIEQKPFQPGTEFLEFEKSLAAGYLSLNFMVKTPDGNHHVSLTGMISPHVKPNLTFWVHLLMGRNQRSASASGASFSDAFADLLAFFGPQATIVPTSVSLQGKHDQGLAQRALCEAFGVVAPTPEETAAATAAEKARRADLKKEMIAELKGGADGIAKFNARPADDFRKMEHFAKIDLKKTALDGLSVMSGLVFAGGKFDGATLTNALIESADFKKASFVGATLKDSRVRANLTGASFKDATISGVDFSLANLSSTDFSGAKVQRCVFNESYLQAANLSQAQFEDCQFKDADYNEQTLLPANVSALEMHWKGQGLPPHEVEQMKQSASETLAKVKQAKSAPGDAASDEPADGAPTRQQRRDEFMARVRQNVDKGKIDKALKMLKAEKFELFVETADDHLVGVVKSQSDADLVYACRLASDGSYQCCTQNLNVCGGLRGSPCKHLLVLTIGLERTDRVEPETLGLWIASSRNRQTTLDKEKMGEVLLRYKSAQIGELDWRPTETTPEDFYSF